MNPNAAAKPVITIPVGKRKRSVRESLLKASAVVGLLATAWVMSDALINYFVKTFTGTLPPITALLPLILVGIVAKFGLRAITPPPAISIALVFGAIGFATGPFLVKEIGLYRFVELVGAFSAFAVGYFSFRWNNNEQTISRLFLIIGGLYVVVCVFALLKVAPSLFPIVNAPWAYRGMIVMRPEVMTDQNFQVFYLFPVALVLALPYRPLRFWTAFALTLGGLFVLAKLQTRSGALVFAGTVLMCLLAPLVNRTLGRGKLLAIPILLLVLLVIAFRQIAAEGNFLLARLADTDYQTGHSRLVSLLYLFEHVYNPLWWVPHGYDEFLKRYQAIPHSNITAMFLEGGIAGLYLWLAVFLLPALGLTKLFFRKKLDLLATMILIGGVSMLVVQLSLNVPFFKQPWLWAGAVVGTLYRVHEKHRGARTERSTTRRQPLVIPSGSPTPRTV